MKITTGDRTDALRTNRKLKRGERRCTYCGDIYRHKKYWTSRLCPAHQETLQQALKERYLIRIQVDSNNLDAELMNCCKSGFHIRKRMV